MSELEISKTLPQLTGKQAAARTEQNRIIGRLGPISLYLHVKQGGIEAEKTTIAKYCSKVYGIEVRTGHYWINRVKALLILNKMSDEHLLQLWTGDRTALPEIPPQDVAEVVVKSDPKASIYAWDHFKAIRDNPTLETEGNAVSFKRLLGHYRPEGQCAFYAHSQDQKPSKTPENDPAKTTVSEPQKPAEIQPRPPVLFTRKCVECGTKFRTEGNATKCDNCKDFKPKILTEVFEEPIVTAEFVPDTDPLDSDFMRQLTACSATNHKSEYFWIFTFTDSEGREYRAEVPHKMMDLALVVGG